MIILKLANYTEAERRKLVRILNTELMNLQMGCDDNCAGCDMKALCVDLGHAYLKAHNTKCTVKNHN